MRSAFEYEKPRSIKICDAPKGDFFKSGLEYNAPVRGGWNIVHTGMLIPETDQIFVCAQGCLRGVILTAAEMNAHERMSWVSVEENDMFDGTLESDITDGVSEILAKKAKDGKKPAAVLLYLSCIHMFAGCDFDAVLNELRTKFPDIDFTDCYMTPTMRTTISPDVKMRIQLYSLLKPVELNKKSVSILGNDIAPDETSEFFKLIRKNGFEIKDIHFCKTYEQYQKMAESAFNITTRPAGKAGGEALSQRTGARHLYLPAAFDFDEIEQNYKTLCSALEISLPDFSDNRKRAENALENAKNIIGDTPMVIDFLAVARQFQLSKLLLEYGFNVKYIVADTLNFEEEKELEFLAKNYPDIEIYSSVNVNMLHLADEKHEKVLSIGQKGAFYFATDYFVNLVSGGGLYGYKGIETLAELMTEAFQNRKDRREVLKLKGHTCESCLL
ncbi:MAG: hypothetical protein J6A07_03145 [Firmicutes bacterium]|nr:hypothetical protein [Bacillota bacterium]